MAWTVLIAGAVCLLIAAFIGNWIRRLRLPTARVPFVRSRFGALFEDYEGFTTRGKNLRAAGRSFFRIGAILALAGGLVLSFT